MMDYEKLIRRLRNDADAYRNGKTLGRAFADQEDVLDNAATALSTLQAENEKLRAELEQAGAEITRLKHYEDKCHDCPIVCAKTEIIKAHEELEAVQAELEQVKQEKDAAVDCINQIQSARDHTRPAYVVDKILSDWRGPEEG